LRVAQCPKPVATSRHLQVIWVESADGLAPALEAAFAQGGVHLVAVPVDYSENMRVLVEELRAHAAKDGAQT